MPFACYEMRTGRDSKPGWNQKIPRQWRNQVDELAKWLTPVPWQFFCTLEFAGRVRDGEAKHRFHDFADFLEQHYRCRIGMVVGTEKRRERDDISRCPRHFHCLLAAPVRLEALDIERWWHAVAGYGQDGRTADVKRFDPALMGVQYCLKFADAADGDYWLRNLEYVLPGAHGPSMNNHRTVRARRRWAMQRAAMEHKRERSRLDPSESMPDISHQEA